MAKINLILVTITTALLACSDIIADSFKALVEKRRCRKTYGSLEDVSWIYTPAVDCYKCEANTVQAAIQHHLDTKNTENKISCMQCLDLSDSASWTGHLLIGPTDGFNSTMYCGPELSSFREGGSKFLSLPASGPNPTTIMIQRIEL
ncbi:hypothetical protein OCU04_009112 [Sclerotinia nivalis]|uniref:Secreted protein CSS2 C-terminal domain-containing protein n=1 Tax=Sclerotinia nivalis TaxID=352851 RepID=A0A9X0AI10_9HELO|nr:hypothetical protein OCU04_009112 [Sclerotinia nivalis]